MDAILHSILSALYMAFAMFWEILWPLILGFALSGVVQAVVSKREMSRLLPDDSPRSLAIACGLGAASSSCSYAAVALARSIFRKGANFTATMAFELASTNLVAELAIILVILMGWQFMVAEFAGAPLMVVARNLGHKDTRMVEKHYGHLAPSYIADAIRAAAPKFGIKPDRKLVSIGARV